MRARRHFSQIIERWLHDTSCSIPIPIQMSNIHIRLLKFGSPAFTFHQYLSILRDTPCSIPIISIQMSKHSHSVSKAWFPSLLRSINTYHKSEPPCNAVTVASCLECSLPPTGRKSFAFGLAHLAKQTFSGPPQPESVPSFASTVLSQPLLYHTHAYFSSIPQNLTRSKSSFFRCSGHQSHRKESSRC